MTDAPKYDVEVELIGQDGNANSLIGIVRRELRRHGVPESEVDEFSAEARSGDYNNVLNTIQKWVNVT